MKDNLLSNGYSLADKVFKKLEEEILNGALKAGENLTELRISARLGVSRTPVREAIHRLEQEGLVQLTPNKGAVVIGISEKDLRNLDSQFHERIYEISGSRTLRQTLSSLHHSIQRYRKMSFATKGRAQKVMIEHQRIVDAIASHDPEAAEKATVDHIEMAATNMLKNLGLSSEEDVHADSAAL